ncbi:MAG TPA: hypothetical protein VF956_10090 [Candidatus Dormibacteraeota bacterium]
MNSNSGDVTRKVLRVLAAGAGLVGGLLGVLGVGAALAGDKYLTDGTLIASIAVLTAIALIGAGIAWWRPVLAAFGMLIALAGYWYAIAGTWASFWSAYQAAINTSGAAENTFWFSGVIAVPSVAIAIPFLVIGCLIALFAHDWSPVAKMRPATTS